MVDTAEVLGMAGPAKAVKDLQAKAAESPSV
jgi:hypothetical protein